MRRHEKWAKTTMAMLAPAMLAMVLASCGGGDDSPRAVLKDPEPAEVTCVIEEVEDEYGMMVEIETCE